MWTSYGVGRYATSEADVLARPRKRASTRGVIYCHGRDGTAAEALHDHWGMVTRSLTEEGRHIVCSADLGGTQTWGNSTSSSRLSDALTYIRAAGASGPVDLYGISMGASVALNWARQNLSSVGAVALTIPAVDLEAVREQVPSLGDEIDTAYGSNEAWEAARPTRNPIEYADEISGLPIRCWYAPDDQTIPASSVTDFALAANATTVNMGGGGHSLTNLDPREITDFFAST